MTLVGTLVSLVIAMVITLVRACRGPSVFDRILAVNAFGTLTVLVISVGGFANGRPEFLDLALLYALISFVGVLAVLRFSKYGNLADDDQAKP